MKIQTLAIGHTQIREFEIEKEKKSGDVARLGRNRGYRKGEKKVGREGGKEKSNDGLELKVWLLLSRI